MTEGVFSIGNALTGLLGYPQRCPGEIQNIAYLIDIPSKSRVVGLSTSRTACFVWTEGGEAFAWGNNEGGLLGVRDSFGRKDTLVSYPERVDRLDAG